MEWPFAFFLTLWFGAMIPMGINMLLYMLDGD